jgi:DegV family protein with EDD domain
MTVAVVTDSAADLSASLREREGIAMVPLSVRFGEDTWQDQVDLDAASFWAKLARAETLPRTAAPSPGAFAEVYRRLRDAGREVVSVHLSGALSATVEAARAGAQMVGEGVSVVDGQSASLGTGLLALWAARAARAGWSRLDVAAALEMLAAAQTVRFSVDTLEYLARGGRIGPAARFIGEMLDVKPILALQQGRIHPVRRVRGASRVVLGLTDWLAAAPPPGPVLAALATSPTVPADTVARLRNTVDQHIAVQEWIVGEIGPVIGVHAGPGAMGLIVLPMGPAAAQAWVEGAKGQ